MAVIKSNFKISLLALFIIVLSGCSHNVSNRTSSSSTTKQVNQSHMSSGWKTVRFLKYSISVPDSWEVYSWIVGGSILSICNGTVQTVTQDVFTGKEQISNPISTCVTVPPGPEIQIYFGIPTPSLRPNTTASKVLVNGIKISEYKYGSIGSNQWFNKVEYIMGTNIVLKLMIYGQISEGDVSEGNEILHSLARTK